MYYILKGFSNLNRVVEVGDELMNKVCVLGSINMDLVVKVNDIPLSYHLFSLFYYIYCCPV